MKKRLNMNIDSTKALSGIGIVFLFAAGIAWLSSGCGSGSKETISSDGFGMMMEYIENHTDFINSPQAPGAIDIEAVLNYRGNRLYLIDMRKPSAFNEGHLPQAVNIPMSRLLFWFENRIDPPSFDTIALISDDGQDAMYATTLLRILGYNNVFGIKLGMCWHKKYFTQYLEPVLSSAFKEHLETGNPPSKRSHHWPIVNTTLQDPYKLIRERAAALLSEAGKGEYRIHADEVFRHRKRLYIINYWPVDEYTIAHIPGAYQYEPRKSLGRETGLGTIPADQTVVIYCYQSNMSASATAYLQLIGYDVRSLEYGTNSFMYNILKEQIGKNYFDKTTTIDYPLVEKGKNQDQKSIPVIKEIKSKGGC